MPGFELLFAPLAESDDDGAPETPAAKPARLTRTAVDDLAVFDAWREAAGLPARDAYASRLFAFAVHERRAGVPARLVRRRLKSVRLHRASATATRIPDEEYATIVRRAGRLDPAKPSILVVADEHEARDGLAAALHEHGVEAWPAASTELTSASARAWDGVLVWIDGHRGLDPYGVVGSVGARLDPVGTASVPLVAVSATAVSTTVRLRLAEAGFGSLLPASWLAEHPERLATVLAGAEATPEFRVGAAAELRAALGLGLDGTLDPFLQVCLQHAPELWTESLPQSELPIADRTTRLLRQLAANVAGLRAVGPAAPAPAVRESTVEFPEWSRVRALVRDALGLTG